MKKAVLICFALFAFSLTTPSAQASSIDLGIAGEYNAFVFENFSAKYGARGVEGRLAAGGDVTLTSYATGTGLAGNESGTNNAVVAGGDLTLTGGSVIHNGNAVIGGTATIPEEGNSTPDGNIVENASDLINWANQRAYLTDLSSQLNGMQNTGTAERIDSSNIIITTDSVSDIQVFDVDGEDWSLATNYAFANDNKANTAPSNATFVFNISGTSVSMHGGMQQFLAALGESYDNVIFNFYEAIELAVYSIDVEGTILAPLANITAFNGGNINGNVIAKSFDGTSFGINDRLFESGGGDPVSPAPVPEPGTLVLFSFGLLLFSGWIKKIMPGKLNA